MAQVTYQKCQCGDAVCKQYTLNTQGSVGFSLEDARLYAAASDLLEAVRYARLIAPTREAAAIYDEAIARATGDTPR